MTDDPTGAVYIGIAYNKDSIEESNNPNDYSWSKILGDKGEDAYTIILSNENISFSVSYEDNLAIGDQSFTTDVRVFYGATERDDFVIGEIGSSNGITVSKTVNSVTLSVTDSTKITAKHGYFRIPISIDGLIFYKDMSWNTVPQGVPGSVGQSALNVSLGNESQNIPCNSEGVTLESFLIEIPFAAYEGFNKVACTASVGVLPSGITLGQNTGSTPDTDGLIILNVARGSNLGGDEVLQGKVVITFIIGESEVIKNFTWTKTKDGATGEAGQFTLYSLESSAPVISKTFEDTFSPESITFSAYSMEGNSGDKTEYSGMFIIEESTNGTTYDTSYLSSADEQSVTFTPTSINVISIRCTLYKAGGITSALDIYTVPVLTDVDNMRPIIDEITTSISGVETKVDSVEKSITDKVWQSDITTQINNYDNTTVKIIRDQVAETQTSLSEIRSTVSDVQTTLTTKADGSTVQTLSEKVSNIEQDAEGFKQTVEENYVTNDDLDENSKTLRSEFNQTAGKIAQSVTDLSGNITSITQDVTSINQKVTDAEGNISSLEQTSQNLQSQIENAEGDISSLQQSADGFNQRVETIEGNISSINQDVGSITQRIADTEGNISNIEQTAEDLQSQITDNKNNIATLEQSANEFKITVSNTYSNKTDSVKSTVEQFYQSTSPTSLVNGSWSTTQPTWKNGTYIWRRTLVTYGDGHTSYTPSSNGVCITGNTGSKGDKGDTGKGIKSTEITYQAGTSGTTPPSGTWSSSIPTVDNGKYLWSKTTITYTDNTTSTSYAASYISIDGETGASGKGINKIEQEYYLSSSKTVQTGGSWVTSMPQWSKGKYLWTRYKITYENPTSTAYTSPICDSSWEAANDVANDLKENYYTKIQTDAAIKVASDSITSTVSTSISNEIDKIEIGGRNYLLNSTFDNGTDKWGFYEFGEGSYEIVDGPSGHKAFSFSRTGYEGELRIGIYNNNITIERFEKGETYTISAIVMVTDELDSDRNSIFVRSAGNGDNPIITIGQNTEMNVWKKYSRTFTPSVTSETNQIYVLLGKNGGLSVSEIKFEKGNKATDWTPAPEDVQEGIDNAQTSADNAQSVADSTESRVTVAESTIQQLSDAISTLVVDENGESMMTQTSEGWRFDMGSINSQLNDAKDQLNNLAGTVNQVDETIGNLNDLANDLSEKTAYITMTTDDSGNPCIELGKSDNDFKVRITNTSIDFMEGSSRIAYLSNSSLYIERAVIKNELQIGEKTGYIWKKRSNNHMGLRWLGG